MTDFSYAVTPLRLSGNPALTEASKEELRALLVLIELGGRVECVADMAKAALEKGLLVLTAKDKLRLLPPLTITYDEIDEGIKILTGILS